MEQCFVPICTGSQPVPHAELEGDTRRRAQGQASCEAGRHQLTAERSWLARAERDIPRTGRHESINLSHCACFPPVLIPRDLVLLVEGCCDNVLYIPNRRTGQALAIWPQPTQVEVPGGEANAAIHRDMRHRSWGQDL